MRYKQNIVQHDKTTILLTTIEVKNTHHYLVANAIANGNFSHQNFKRTKISRI